MTSSPDTGSGTLELTIDKQEFELRGPDDDLRVDGLCRSILRRFYDGMIAGGTNPAEATALASGADYFVRDFLVDRMRLSIFSERPGTVRKFAGNWYITSTVEPDVKELAIMLMGVRDFYRCLNSHGLISAGYLGEVEKECGDLSYYAARIDSYWRITGDGFRAWDRECGLKD